MYRTKRDICEINNHRFKKGKYCYFDSKKIKIVCVLIFSNFSIRLFYLNYTLDPKYTNIVDVLSV